MFEEQKSKLAETVKSPTEVTNKRINKLSGCNEKQQNTYKANK